MKQTYTANEIRYYGFMYRVEKVLEDGKKIRAYNFHIFDHYGYEWVTIFHATRALLKRLFPYILEKRTIWETDPQPWSRIPLIDIDSELVKGDAEAGYLVDSIKDKFGLDITLLHDIQKDL